MKLAAEPAGNVARPSCETTDAVLLGRACSATARYETPTNKPIASVPRIPSVAAAFLPCGRRNALTPLAIASTPVNAVDPEAKARRTTKVVSAPVPAVIGCGTTACG